MQNYSHFSLWAGVIGLEAALQYADPSNLAEHVPSFGALPGSASKPSISGLARALQLEALMFLNLVASCHGHGHLRARRIGELGTTLEVSILVELLQSRVPLECR